VALTAIRKALRPSTVSVWTIRWDATVQHWVVSVVILPAATSSANFCSDVTGLDSMLWTLTAGGSSPP